MGPLAQGILGADRQGVGLAISHLEARTAEDPLPNSLMLLLAGLNISWLLAGLPPFPCHVGLSTELLMTQRLASVRVSKQERVARSYCFTVLFSRNQSLGPVYTPREGIDDTACEHWEAWITGGCSQRLPTTEVLPCVF